MRKKNCVFVMVLLLLATGCTTGPGGEMSTEPVDVSLGSGVSSEDMIGTWRGIIPCADCPGINYNLSLNDDLTFEETMVYQDRDVQPYTRTGAWRIVSGTLELSSEEPTPTRFDISTPGELNMLDQSGKRITSELGAMYRLVKDNNLPEDNPELWAAKRKLGIEFVATGNEPGWVLEIDKEKGMFFKTLPTETIAINTPVPVPTINGNRTIYKATTEAGELEVELIEEPCEDTMSGKVSAYTVRVTAKGIKFKGCGMYLNEIQNDEE